MHAFPTAPRALLALILGLSGSAFALDGPATWKSLQGLTGTWQTTTKSGARIELELELVSKDSALVERYRVGSTETLTIFHPDGASVLATHYCAQGNQPRLRLDQQASTAGHLVFTYLDATNLEHPTDSHLWRLTLDLPASGELIMRETYLEHGKPDPSTLTFTRAEPHQPMAPPARER